jgi:hypothetical protein
MKDRKTTGDHSERARWCVFWVDEDGIPRHRYFETEGAATFYASGRVRGARRVRVYEAHEVFGGVS